MADDGQDMALAFKEAVRFFRRQERIYDDAVEALSQWKQQHRNFTGREPGYLQLERMQDKAMKDLKDTASIMNAARKAAKVWKSIVFMDKFWTPLTSLQALLGLSTPSKRKQVKAD
ncbi:hypothetical protein Poli38472_005067 [Pythium oligandrum]|uniref:Uncharacterized protein n=1 Tax=Pythium oligandrum TaxID=41045 RepID=A0A8K1CG76_PYTOL|nr:hypothetical protein Poli38472_005067 [Pythium oligandrum]|eukprot:TMW62449.1 hypothetical protein Poli38472_005067 [Pythium oligandrum]